MMPRVFIFGNTSFSRASIPAILADFEQLPTVDESALTLELRQAYKNNLEAYRLFVAEKDVPLRQIRDLTGVDPKQLYLLLQRVLVKAEDGRIQGLRGLIPFKHIKEYERCVAVKATSVLFTKNASGAMAQLLKKFPSLETWSRKNVRLRNKPLRPGEIREVKKSVRSLHTDFLKKCKYLGVQNDEYPFNQDLLGFRSFQALVKQITLEQKGSHRKADDQPASVEAQPDMEFERWPVGNVPFKLVQFDGHKIDVRLTLVVNDPFGMQTVIEIARIWILVVKDVSTRCVLGYYIAYGVEYNKDDVAEAIQAAIVPHRRMKLTIPGLEIKEGGGFPNEVMPELEYHRLSWFHYDTAKSHIAQDSLDRLADVLGCWTMSGRLGIADDRAIIERFFGLFEEFFHQIPGTTGSKPSDPVRRLGDVGTDHSRLVTVEELEQLVEVVIGNTNGDASSALGGRTPLEAMMYQTSKPEFMLQTLPVSRRHQLFLLKEATIKVVRGAKTAPHINFEGVKYTSDLLVRRHELVGKTLRIYFIARDIRTIHAFFEDGSELGILVASRQWRKTPHSLRLRKEILRNIRLGFLRVGPGDDPVEAYVRNKRKAATESKRAGNSIAKVRAGIAAANSAAAFGDSPFGPVAPPETALSDEQASRSVPKKKTKPGELVVPVPLTLKKTLLF
ncbi:MAG: hypothetical protein PSV40_01210 [Polaromonas sp.]|jgi:putative transposase|uniref:hypothetical protein n=1 Tax=Polaromonas sp. TaxID=1869339 RepID=UPI0024886BFD|nr:hypothetical protein [Polaromonas sp.]MDI1267710.1 hypothetical protein [Polaromonas sp.]